MKKIIVLGAGMVGSAIARDLAPEFAVTSADISRARLDALSPHHPIEVVVADLADPDRIRRSIEGFDLAINALPGFMGTAALRAIIEAGVDVVDISFSPEDPFELDELAIRHKVRAVVDCGVAPGLCNIIFAYESGAMDTVERYECLVGGLPVIRQWPFEYGAVFSPVDVIEEYTRPARYVENGQEVVRPALSDRELVDFAGIGTLESFNTDGLRSLIRTMKVPNMKEKTLRYPGHAELMAVFRETGLFDKTPLEIGGTALSPLEFTSRLLFPKWQMTAADEDFTIMRVTVSGTRQGRPHTAVTTLLDRFDRETHTTSMARTTGYTCTAAARLLLAGGYSREGISPPEYLGSNPASFEEIRRLLAERNIILDVSRS